jgi:membrane protease YdiL (CAAX protease family)
MKELFKKIHTERFRWYDEIILAAITSFFITLLGQIVGLIICKMIDGIFASETPFYQTFRMYLSPIGVWVFCVIYFLIAKHRRPILKAVGTKPKGNNVRFLLLGLAIGFGLNFFCALIAMINRDIHLSFKAFDPLCFLGLLFAVFVQSSSEELVDRAYLYQIIRKGYRNKWVAIIGNALIFSLMHALNPGVTVLALTNIFFSGLLFSLFVYYFDSIWCAYGIHTGWNFTQSILLGLPNSGLVVPYSIFELDTANANNSFVYNIAFGIEGTIFSTILLALACLAVYLIGKKRHQEPTDIWA